MDVARAAPVINRYFERAHSHCHYDDVKCNVDGSARQVCLGQKNLLLLDHDSKYVELRCYWDHQSYGHWSVTQLTEGLKLTLASVQTFMPRAPSPTG